MKRVSFADISLNHPSMYLWIEIMWCNIPLAYSLNCFKYYWMSLHICIPHITSNRSTTFSTSITAFSIDTIRSIKIYLFSIKLHSNKRTHVTWTSNLKVNQCSFKWNFLICTDSYCTTFFFFRIFWLIQTWLELLWTAIRRQNFDYDIALRIMPQIAFTRFRLSNTIHN